MKPISEINSNETNITEVLDDVELTADVIDKIQRLKQTKWSGDFKSRLAQFILGATALLTVNHWGVDMPKESWIGNSDLPVQQSVEYGKRRDFESTGALPPEIDPELIPLIGDDDK